MFGHYFTIALRNVRRAPLTAAINVIALAVGLAAFITAYGVVGFWNQSERHFANAERTYVVTANLEAKNGPLKTGVTPTTNRLYADYLRAEFPDFEAVARTQAVAAEGGVSAGDVNERMYVIAADPSFLDIFDLPFLAGDAKKALQTPNSVVLTQDAAKRLFGTDQVVGRTLTLATLLDLTVTGVIGAIPEPSYFGHSAAATVRFDALVSWDSQDALQNAVRARNPAAAPPVPPPNAPPPPENWLGGYCCMTFAMLKKDSPLTPAAVDAQLRDFGNRHLPVAQQEIATLTVGGVPLPGLMVSQLNAQLLGGSGISITTVLFALASLVLVVACVNYASLATAQAARRAREVGLRKAIGASRGRVMLQYLAEAAVLTLAAAVVAFVAVRLLTPLLRNSVGINLSVGLYGGFGFAAFIVGLLALVTLLGGAYPAFVLARVPPIEALRIGRTKAGPRFATTILVGAQFAAASFLLIVVTVMYAQNGELQRTGLGTSSDPVVVLPNFSQYSGIDSVALQDQLLRIPQVKGVSATAQSPWSAGVGLAGVARTPDQSVFGTATAILNNVGYDYFATLGYTVLGGRGFDREHGDDARPQGPPTGKPYNVVIDAALATDLGFSPPSAAVEQDVYFPASAAFGGVAQPLHIVGVVANRSLRLSSAGATANLFFMRPDVPFQLVRLSAADVSGGLAAIDALWNRLSPKLSSGRKFLDELYDENYRNFARVNQVSAALALVAIAISIAGLFGMAVQVASRRLHEIGVRKSVGAHARQIVGMLLAQFSRPVLVANLIAWPLAYIAAQKYLSVFSTRVALTPLPFLASLAATIAVACLVVAGQAWRAARVNPATVLRSE
jgi:putative ABC transport system permease protein